MQDPFTETRIPIDEQITASELTEELAALGAEELVAALQHG